VETFQTSITKHTKSYKIFGLDASLASKDTFHLSTAYKLFMYADNMRMYKNNLETIGLLRKEALEILQRESELQEMSNW